jgi:hypothetical protein
MNKLVAIPRLTKIEVERRAFVVLSGLAFMVYDGENKKRFLFVADLNNPNVRALFVYNRTNKNFDLYTSNYSDENRKYEMLYILERNNSMMCGLTICDKCYSSLKGGEISEKHKTVQVRRRFDRWKSVSTR